VPACWSAAVLPAGAVGVLRVLPLSPPPCAITGHAIARPSAHTIGSRICLRIRFSMFC